MPQNRDLRLKIAGENSKINLLIDTGKGLVRDVEVLNLSRNGFYMQGPLELSVNKEIEARVSLPNMENPISVICKVKWVRPAVTTKNSANGFGIFMEEFVGDSQDTWQEHFARLFYQYRLDNLVSKQFLQLSQKDSVEAAVKKFRQARVQFAIVLDDNQQPVGVLSPDDFLPVLLDPSWQGKNLSSVPLRQIQTLAGSQTTKELLALNITDTHGFVAITGAQSIRALAEARDLLPFWLEHERLGRENMERRFRQGLSVVAHELKSPLTIIDAANKFLLNQKQSPADFIKNDLPQMINENCRLMDNLIDDLLIVANPRSSLNSPQVELDLRQICEAAIHSFSLAAESKRQQLIFACHGDDKWTYLGDERKIKQILYNLISNAIKFSRVGGKVEVHLHNYENAFAIQVMDQGPGIDQHEMGKIFTAFSDIQNHPTANEKSTGLGLAIAYNLAHSIGAKLSVDSEKGRGSEFSIRLPKMRS